MVSACKIWRLGGERTEQQLQLAREVGVSPLIAQVLLNRGITTRQQARNFLTASLDNIHDPFLIRDMDKAVDRLNKALTAGEQILIYGDYDVDGISGTALLVAALRELGGRVDYYIPERLQEGYGLNEKALQRAAQEGYEMLITVDCGIAAVKEVAAGLEYGLDFIITDHHQPQEQLPPALAVLNPKRCDCSYPYSELAGVGVALKLVQALGYSRGYSRDWWQQYLDLVVLGTVADIVPLQDENRILVKYGLKALRDSKRAGIKALLAVTGLAGRELRPGQIGFVLGPRLNACGRLGRADRGVELLLATDGERAEQLARALDRENCDRQAIEADILNQARARVEEEMDWERDRVIVLGSPDWHPGVIGIVASRLVELYYRPTLLIGFQDGLGKGSARSIPGFHIFKALSHCDGFLQNYGGHEQAAGVSLPEDKLPALRQCLNRLAWEWLEEEQLYPVQPIDAEIGIKDLDFALLDVLEGLAPFGMGNPEPVFACRGTELVECRGVGEDANHLKLRVRQGRCEMDGIGFRMGKLAREIERYKKGIDLAFTLQRNEWQGKTSLQLVIKDLCGSQMAAGEGEGALREWRLEDRRGQADKFRLTQLLGRKGKTLVCVNTASEAKELARRLQEEQPHPGTVASFHAGLSSGERARVQDSVADGRVSILVATPFYAPAETLSDFTQVIWYDLNFNPREFRRLCCTVGAPGSTVTVYLLFGKGEGERNRTLLAGLVPPRRVLGAVYVLLQRARQEGMTGMGKERILKILQGQGKMSVQPHTLSIALDVLADLHLVRSTGSNGWRLLDKGRERKLRLDHSPTYCRKKRERDKYLAFQEFLLQAPAAEILTYLREGRAPIFFREEAT